MNTTTLAAMGIRPCGKDTPPLAARDCESLLQHLPLWRVQEAEDGLILQRGWRFGDYAQALAFTNRVAALAEDANHHPALLLEWGKVEVSWWTHTIGGLHLNDFIMAARCELASLRDGPAGS